MADACDSRSTVEERRTSKLYQLITHDGRSTNTPISTYAENTVGPPDTRTDNGVINQMQLQRWADCMNLSGHPNPANDGHLKTGQRELIPGR